MVVMEHIHILFPWDNINEMMKCFRIPLYFFLSGLFFKEYGGFKDFAVRKANKLVVPFIFFAYIPYLFYEFAFYDGPYSAAHYILMLLEPYNSPLWFLRSLFITYIIFYSFNRYTKNISQVWKATILVIITLGTWFLNNALTPYREEGNLIYIIYRYTNIFPAIMALPYIYMASELRKAGILSKQFKWWKLLCMFIIFSIIWWLTSTDGIEYKTGKYGPNYLFLYTSALSGIGTIWCIAYTLKKIFFVSYLGRYSIIVLGTHLPIILPLTYNTTLPNHYIALITLLLMPPVIWLFKKLFPYFTAQKDLFYCDAQGKLHWGWNRK